MNDYRGSRYGQAGKSLGESKTRSKFGQGNARAGMVGERYLSDAIRRNVSTRNYTMYQSLRMPSMLGQKKYHDVDIDFALVSGNKVVLIDSKMWSAKHFYWSFFGRVMKGFEPGEVMSKNMEMARARFRDALPGHQVEAIVCFVPTRGGKLPKSVGLLFWPGMIRSYMPNDALVKAAKVLGEPKPASERIQSVLGKLTR